MQPSKWEVWPWNWRKVRKAKISKQDRDLFERYGEAVIGNILAGGTPIARELQAILPHYDSAVGPAQDKFAEARNWLTECRDSQHRREQRLETVEIGVVALIAIEIFLSLYFGFRAISEGREQAAILQQMNKNTEVTTLQIQRAADAQAESSQRLKEMNDKLQASLTTTGTMASATRKQLNILEQEQAERTAKLAKKPKLQLFIGSVPVVTGPFNVLHPPIYPIRDQTDTSVTFDSGIINLGTASATRVQVRVIVLATDVSLSATGNVSRPTEPQDNPFKTWLINLDFIRQNVNVPMTLTFSFPKGHTPFQVAINVDADEIETATPLGNFTITPRKPADEK